MVRATSRRAGDAGHRRDRRGVVALAAVGKGVAFSRGTIFTPDTPLKAKRGHGRHDDGDSYFRWYFADPAIAATFARESRRKALPALAGKPQLVIKDSLAHR
jgi:hypothetical protein